MTIITNLARNGRLAVDATDWLSATTGISVVRGTWRGLPAAVGTVTATSTSMVGAVYVYGLQPDVSYSFALDLAADHPGAVRGRISVAYRTSANANIGSVVAGPLVTLSGTSYTRASIGPLLAPAGTDRAIIYWAAQTSGGGNLAGAVGNRVAATRLIATPAAGYDLAYRDGDDPLWAWSGVAGMSASLGPDVITWPEAQLRLNGQHVEWIDLVPGFAESAQLRSSSQVNAQATGRQRFVTVRPAVLSTGSLTMHLVRESGVGGPGARAERVWQSLATGAPHRLEWYSVTGDGLQPIDFLPVDVGERERLQRSEAWTVTTGFERALA